MGGSVIANVKGSQFLPVVCYGKVTTQVYTRRLSAVGTVSYDHDTTPIRKDGTNFVDLPLPFSRYSSLAD
jgi:hypothetical protein